MREDLLALITQLRTKPYTDRAVLDQFEVRVNEGPPYTRDEGSAHHFCSFLLPVNMQERRVYLGHHIKGASWMPPGGHIDRGERVITAVIREFQEELQQTITDRQVELFTASIIQISRPGPCATHFDFWHLVHTDVIDFPYDPKEFHDAQWFRIEKAVTQVTHPVYHPIMELLADKVF